MEGGEGGEGRRKGGREKKGRVPRGLGAQPRWGPSAAPTPVEPRKHLCVPRGTWVLGARRDRPPASAAHGRRRLRVARAPGSSPLRRRLIAREDSEGGTSGSRFRVVQVPSESLLPSRRTRKEGGPRPIAWEDSEGGTRRDLGQPEARGRPGAAHGALGVAAIVELRAKPGGPGTCLLTWVGRSNLNVVRRRPLRPRTPVTRMAAGTIMVETGGDTMCRLSRGAGGRAESTFLSRSLSCSLSLSLVLSLSLSLISLSLLSLSLPLSPSLSLSLSLSAKPRA